MSDIGLPLAPFLLMGGGILVFLAMFLAAFIQLTLSLVNRKPLTPLTKSALLTAAAFGIGNLIFGPSILLLVFTGVASCFSLFFWRGQKGMGLAAFFCIICSAGLGTFGPLWIKDMQAVRPEMPPHSLPPANSLYIYYNREALVQEYTLRPVSGDACGETLILSFHPWRCKGEHIAYTVIVDDGTVLSGVADDDQKDEFLSLKRDYPAKIRVELAGSAWNAQLCEPANGFTRIPATR